MILTTSLQMEETIIGGDRMAVIQTTLISFINLEKIRQLYNETEFTKSQKIQIIKMIIESK